MKISLKQRKKLRRDAGQAYFLIIVFISFFLLGVLGLATDYTQVWAHRQMAQAATDAACQAGAADLYLAYTTPTASTALGNTWIGTGYTCLANPTDAPCKYATYNGYNAGNSTMNISFPTSITGVTAIPSIYGVTTPYIQVDTTDNVALSFAKFATGSATQTIKAKAVCGMVSIDSPIPLVVLHPTLRGAFSISGSPTVTIIGGPSRSIQVNSIATTGSGSSDAVVVGGSASVDLSAAGPTPSTGADFGVTESMTKPTGVTTGTGTWVSPASAYTDPWANVATPSAPASTGTAINQPLGYNGCPDPSGCVEFTPGNYSACSTANTLTSGANACINLPFGGSNAKYTSAGTATAGYSNWNNNTAYAALARVIPKNNNAAGFLFEVSGAGGTSGASTPTFPQSIGSTVNDNGILWKNIGTVTSTPNTAIFQPGLYYVGSSGVSFTTGTSSARMSTAAGDGTQGAMFYFNSATSLSAGAGSGGQPACTSLTVNADGTISGVPGSGGGCLVSYMPNGSSQFTSVTTGGGSGVASRTLYCSAAGLSSISSILNPATAINGNVLMGPCSGTYGDATSALYRGFIFFENRSLATSATWGGGSGSLVSGFMYFHQNTSYGSSISLSGGASSGAVTLGNTVTDSITLGGSSAITMNLNTAATFPILKPQMIQ